jgi:DNA-binding NarL/FixJ family response regulator
MQQNKRCADDSQRKICYPMSVMKSDLTVRAMIAAPTALMASSLRTFINTISGVEVVAQAYTHPELRQMIDDLRPHMLILDADLTDGNVAGFVQALLKPAPDLCIVILVNNLQQRTTALAAGASHALLKGWLNEELRSAIMPDNDALSLLRAS